jgi:hypothetical protein
MARILKITFLIVIFIALLVGFVIPAPQHGLQPAFGQQPYTYIFPLFLYQPHLLTSTSYYITTLNAGFLYNLGCQLGTRDKNTPGAQNSVAVLAFGYPRCSAAGSYGANLFGYGPASISNVRDAVRQFALGYYNCTGSDITSNLVIGAGTSNYLGGTDPCNTLAKATAHGKAWSTMVRDLNQWAVSQGIIQQVQIYGANDIELGWNSPAWSRAWIAGFEQVSGNFMLHFGDAAGCPYEDNPHWSCGTSTYLGWTIEDVWYVSYGAPSALPLPLIYLTTGVHAKQWANLSRYSVTQHGYRMDFTGVFTQWRACQQFGGCYTTDNTPDAAYQQLSFELSKSPATAQNLPWKTDIRWIMQNEITAAGFLQEEPADESVVHPARECADALNAVLDEPLMSTVLRSSLESKQAIYQSIADLVALSQKNPAPKGELITLSPADAPELTFHSGIFERGEIPGLPYGAELNNVWQSQTESGYMQVGAGSSPEGEQRGALYVIMVSLDQMTIQSTLIQAPEGCGPLTIVRESEGLLDIISSDGCQFTFDLSTLSLLQAPN